MRRTSIPQLSNILANGKSYAVSIVIGCRAAFMRARSGTRTFSCVTFFSERSVALTKRKSGLPRNRQPRVRAISNERALESLGVPVRYRIQARADYEPKLSDQHRLAGERLTR